MNVVLSESEESQLGNRNQDDFSIFKVIGQKVATLVSQTQQAGFHQVEWDAGDLASGIYYYQLVAGDPSAGPSGHRTGSGQRFNEVRKMILIR